MHKDEADYGAVSEVGQVTSKVTSVFSPTSHHPKLYAYAVLLTCNPYNHIVYMYVGTHNYGNVRE